MTCCNHVAPCCTIQIVACDALQPMKRVIDELLLQKSSRDGAMPWLNNLATLNRPLQQAAPRRGMSRCAPDTSLALRCDRRRAWILSPLVVSPGRLCASRSGRWPSHTAAAATLLPLPLPPLVESCASAYHRRCPADWIRMTRLPTFQTNARPPAPCCGLRGQLACWFAYWRLHAAI